MRAMWPTALPGEPQITSNIKNTITGPKALIGKKFHSDDVQAEIPLVAYALMDVAGDVGIPVSVPQSTYEDNHTSCVCAVQQL